MIGFRAVYAMIFSYSCYHAGPLRKPSTQRSLPYQMPASRQTFALRSGSSPYTTTSSSRHIPPQVIVISDDEDGAATASLLASSAKLRDGRANPKKKGPTPSKDIILEIASDDEETCDAMGGTSGQGTDLEQTVATLEEENRTLRTQVEDMNRNIAGAVNQAFELEDTAARMQEVIR
ncbi:hypothetical protein CONPUDRAFT_75418 [Coniophora puteana RWD-64-598 SS2]|uniref:Uncharacterized protein n=1 Tax=Coniophora puteana (strain RWD-64-598) TaxID=741705 RepID=A0A5M3MEB3_CONPW|nr:uncharacterized protein CONPUDRAFT_75418 [Coniophora puteana RWD-64-598 SS2]EIW77562.1 hypothetical protein CONPUDRAFT_75418 [Coniophora puteana RWD-64-598 SS2]